VHICDVCEHYYLDEKATEEVLKRGSEGLLKGAELEVMKLKVAKTSQTSFSVERKDLPARNSYSLSCSYYNSSLPVRAHRP